MADMIDTSGNLKTRTNMTKPSVNFNFMLRIEAAFDVPCKSIKVIRKENEYDYIQEGGLNDYVHMIRKPITKPFTLQIERYVGESFYDPLSLGTKLLLPVFLNVGRYLNPAFFLPDRQYVFTGCEVMSKEYGELNAERSGLLTETTTIAFSRMFTIDSPFDGEKETWAFDEYAKDGNGEGHRNKSMDDFELSKDDMAARTQRWSMAQNHGGSENRKEASISSRQNLLLEGTLDMSMKDMADKANLWEFDKDSSKSEGKGISSAETPITKGIQMSGTGTEAEMAERAIKWEIDTKKNFGGKGDAARANVVEVKDRTGAVVGEAGHGIKEDRADTLADRAARWEFDTRDNPDGKGVSSRQSNKVMMDADGNLVSTGIGVEVGDRQSFADNASMWEFDGNKPGGNGVKNRANYSESTDADGNTSSSGTGVREMGRSEMEAKANLWEFDGAKTGGNGIKNRANYTESTDSGGDTTSSGIGIREAGKEEMSGRAKKWEFDGDKTSGKGNISSADSGIEQASSSDMKASAKKWEFQDNKTSGNGNISAVDSGIRQLSREEMEKKASLWPGVKSAKTVADFLSNI